MDMTLLTLLAPNNLFFRNHFLLLLLMSTAITSRMILQCWKMVIEITDLIFVSFLGSKHKLQDFLQPQSLTTVSPHILIYPLYTI